MTPKEKLARMEEREACAKIRERYQGASRIAKEIRAQSDQPDESTHAATDSDPPGIDCPVTPKEIVMEAARDLNALGIKAKEIRIKWHDAIGVASQPAVIEIEAEL